jgi:tetratricopeptide (TPR) repeat protein
MRKSILKGLLLALMSGCLPTAAFPIEASLGQVTFANTCKREVQVRFLNGIALLHSFEFKEAEQAFTEVETHDPTCSIAAWGIALAETERAGANAPQKTLAAGWEQLQPWLAKPAGSKRERLYLEAVRAMYEGYAQVPEEVRWQRYLERMDTLRRAYPEDKNASLLYAIGLVWTAGAGEKGLDQRRKALSILLPIFDELPNNPGAAHYIIHAADTPELASIALPAAHKYAAIAPDSPHALHMPSHIFNRVGDWQDSIDSNLRSARVAEQWLKSGRDGQFDELHALNNLEYAYLQMGEQAQAREAMQKIDRFAAMPGGDPWLSADARIYFDVDTHDWKDGLRIQPPAQSAFDENFDAYWMNTIAAARLGKPVEASASLEQFRQSLAAWRKTQGHSWELIWGAVLDLALDEAEAWTLFSQGKQDQAVRELTNAVSFEQAHPMYYADILPRPSSEMLADMLLQMGKRREACAAYQASLKVAPNRFDSLAGLRASCESTAATR